MSEPCGLGMCAAPAGHAGTCPEASGWAEDAKPYRIRASGGRVAVSVRYRPLEDRWRLGPWVWEVPMPKNHPQPPSSYTLTGRARSRQLATMDGLRRLEQVYGPRAHEVRERQRNDSLGLAGAIRMLRERLATTS